MYIASYLACTSLEESLIVADFLNFVYGSSCKIFSLSDLFSQLCFLFIFIIIPKQDGTKEVDKEREKELEKVIIA